MNKIYIVWDSFGSYEDYRKYIHKVYTNEDKASAEKDRLNTELKNKQNRVKEIEEEYFSHSCEDSDTCPICEEFYSLGYYDEQWDYTVECVEVEE
jgi:hypothetical protein